MNLYFRLFWMLFRLLFKREEKGLTEPFRRPFRVWPSDCDFNLHLTNGRYFSLLDVARVEHLARMKLLVPLLMRGWLPVLNATEITFIRPLPPFGQFDIMTRIVSWDEKYLYLEQCFETPGTLHAVSLARAVFLHRGEILPPSEVAALAGYSGEAPPVPIIIRTWLDLLQEKRDHFSGLSP